MTEPIPTDPEQLRELALLAEVLLSVDGARERGLMRGGPTFDVRQAEEIVVVAREHGIEFSEAEIIGAAGAFAAEL